MRPEVRNEGSDGGGEATAGLGRGRTGQGHVWSAVPALQGTKQKPEGPVSPPHPATLCARLCPERMLTPKDPGGISKAPKAFVGPRCPDSCSPTCRLEHTHPPLALKPTPSSESLCWPRSLTPRLRCPH